MKAKFIKVSEAAGIIGVHRTTIYRWAREGKIKIYKFGKASRISVEELEKFIASAETLY